MVDVVIVGGGPNGLMLACELGLAGVRPVILDAGPGPNPEKRAAGIAGQGVRMFDHRGLYETLAGTAELPKPAPGALFAGFAMDFTRIPDHQMYTMIVEQPRLVKVLHTRARAFDVDVRWGHAMTGYHQDGSGVTVKVDGPDGSYELSTQYLVGADGGSSRTRKLAGIGFPGMSSYDVIDRVAFGVVPPADWVDQVNGALHVPGVGAIAARQFFRTDRGIFQWGSFAGRSGVFTMELDSSPRGQPDGGDGGHPPMTMAEQEASIARVLGAAVPLRPEFPGLAPDLRRIRGVNSRIASHYRAGRVLLVGDAAHVQSPLGGPGLNLGLQDAVNLGWKLAAVLEGRVPAHLLDTYEAERRPAAERVIMHSRAQLALLRPGPEASALRELFGELAALPGVVGHLGDLVSGADVRYESAPGDHALVGRWVPDLEIALETGTARIAELARSGWPLLIDLTESGAVAAAAAAVSSRVTVAAGRPAGDPPAAAMLVRPDGYVAWAMAAEHRVDVDGLDRALCRWFGFPLSRPRAHSNTKVTNPDEFVTSMPAVRRTAPKSGRRGT